MQTKDFLTKNPAPATHKPFGELPKLAVQADRSERKSPKGRTINRSRKPVVDAIYVCKLVEAMGSATKAAEALYLTPSTTRTAIRTGKITNTVEGHAKAYYLANFEKPEVQAKDGQVFVSMMIDHAAFNHVKNWLTEAGAVYKVFK